MSHRPWSLLGCTHQASELLNLLLLAAQLFWLHQKQAETEKDVLPHQKQAETEKDVSSRLSQPPPCSEGWGPRAPPRMLRVGQTVTHLSLGSSGKPCIRRPPWGWLSSPVPGNAGLHMAGLVSAGCGQMSWAVPEASRAPLPALRWPHCLLEPPCKYSQPLFTHPPVEAGGCGLCLVSSMTSWARGRPSLPRPAQAPSTPSFGHFPVAPWCDLRPGLPWIESVLDSIIQSFS